MTADRLDSSREPEVVSVLADAFRDYPVFRFVLGPSGTTDARVHLLTSLFVFRRIRMGGPMLGIHDGAGRLVGAAIMTLPHEPPASPEVTARRDAMFDALGQDCRERYDMYSAAVKPLLTSEPHHHLNMIGVVHAAQGKGFARPLLEAAIALAAADPNSPGLTLTTELRRNVELYEYFGFRITGQAHVTPDLETWGMFRPR